MKRIAIVMSLLAAVPCARARSAPVDLTHAVVVAPADSPREALAVRVLVEEVEKRSRLKWLVARRPVTGRPSIVVGRAARLGSLAGQFGLNPSATWKPEGFRLIISAKTGGAMVAGADSRGVLYGVGKLLRSLRMERDRVTADPIDLATAPYHRLRGHQLGYRPKTNSYDGWTVPMWEQYIRDLAVFGANAVELLPPRTDDDADSPHFPLPPMRMMVEMSRLLDAYGMDVWVWYPAMDRDYSVPATVARSLKEWGDVFRRLPQLDAVLVPGGDPGHTQPRILMALLEKQAANLRRYHPRAQMWVSPQGFTAAWMDEFLTILRRKQPRWLTGVVFGPQVRMPLPRLRALVPARYPIRHYPDITHSRQCQFPVPGWDTAFALTEGREAINPRPTQEAVICRYHQPFTIGSITYSEGCNDDVNKAVWSALEWDPKVDVRTVLREYSRCFVSNRLTDSFAEGLLALERNWMKAGDPVASYESALQTLESFQAMEKAATPQEKLNWRFQQALYRAYYDAVVQYRQIRYSGDEGRVLGPLSDEIDTQPGRAIERAIEALEKSGRVENSTERQRVFELAEALFQSIRMQLSVPKYQAIGIERGANLDAIDIPLNDRNWLLARLREARSLPPIDQRAAIKRLVNWTDPGPGGFYDEPGNPARAKHLLIGPGFERDPGFMESVRTGYIGTDDLLTYPPIRLSWARFAETLYDTPLRMRWPGLDPAARYRMRVVYGPDNPQLGIRCVAETAGGPVEVHPLKEKPDPPEPLEFDIPPAASASGTLTLRWNRSPGYGGNGRGCQISEIWILKVKE